jgi:hypothetical protein
MGRGFSGLMRPRHRRESHPGAAWYTLYGQSRMRYTKWQLNDFNIHGLMRPLQEKPSLARLLQATVMRAAAAMIQAAVTMLQHLLQAMRQNGIRTK